MTKAAPNTMRFDGRRTGWPATAVAALLAACGWLAACKPFDVNLATAKPLAGDFHVRLDIYQYSKPLTDVADTAPKDVASVTERRRNRMDQVNRLKGSRLVGENHRAQLTIRDQPAGKDGDWVKKTVEEENQDRIFLMVEEAKKENLEMHEVQDREWKLNLERALPGEWIEIVGDKEGVFKWIPKAAK